MKKIKASLLLVLSVIILTSIFTIPASAHTNDLCASHEHKIVVATAEQISCSEAGEIAPYVALCSCGGKILRKTWWEHYGSTSCIYGGQYYDVKATKYAVDRCQLCDYEYSGWQTLATATYCRENDIYYNYVE